jgi:hypothetical protein
MMLAYFMAIWSIWCSIGIFCVRLVYFVFVWYILCSFGIFYDNLEYFVAIWYILHSFGIFFRFGMLYQERSGIPFFPGTVALVSVARYKYTYRNFYILGQGQTYFGGAG